MKLFSNRHFMTHCVGALAAAMTICAAANAEPATPAADPLDPLIDAYERYVEDREPTTKARAAGEPVRRWSDVRPATIAGHADEARQLKTAIAATKTDRRIDQSVLLRLLQSDINSAEFDSARIPFVGDWGFQAEPVFAAMQTRINSEAEARAWIARLNDVPRYFSENIENMRRGVDTGWTASEYPLNTMTDQIREQIMDDPLSSTLYMPFETLPDTLSPEQAATLREDGRKATARAIQAYRDTLRFIETEYRQNVREGAGIAGLKNGRDAYAAAVEHHTAGAGYTPEEIHALGNQEVTRIRAEMDKIIAEIAFEGSFKEFQAFLRTDPQFYAQTDTELMEKASTMSKRLDALLPSLFRTLPRLPYGVSPVPAAIAPGYTTGRYVQGDAEEGRAGTYLVNTYALDQRPLYELPALSAHEAVPGHHLQIALAQEMQGQPRFRRDYYATAFGEGWGLYSEKLAGEAGFYETPYERFGALSYEMWRACRLVADTGLHWYGWSREEAEACFEDNSALAPLNIQTEVTRYIGWPGQAVAYKVGELKILDLRAEAKAALGDAFDIRDFHDAVLSNGAVPMDVLETQVRAWITDTQASAKAEAAPVNPVP